MTRFDKGRAVVAAISIVVLVGLVVILGMRSDPPPPINGDSLGMERGESFTDYAARADESLSALNDESAHHFALVTFTEPLEAEPAGEVTEPVGRVNAMMIAGVQLRPLPEPVDGEDRSDVYARELDRVAAALEDVPMPGPIDTLNAVVVWDHPEILRALDDDPQVAAVEALPADAQWGRFGVSPVIVPE